MTTPTKLMHIDFPPGGIAQCACGSCPAPEVKPTRVEVGQRYEVYRHRMTVDHFDGMYWVGKCDLSHDHKCGWDPHTLLTTATFLGYAKPAAVAKGQRWAVIPGGAVEFEVRRKNADGTWRCRLNDGTFENYPEGGITNGGEYLGMAPNPFDAAGDDEHEWILEPIKFAPPRPIRREVSANGRDWCDYARLTDADPFESYPWRRVYCGTEFIEAEYRCPPARPDPGRAETQGDLAGAAAAALVSR